MVLVVTGLMVAVELTTRDGSELPAALVIGKGVAFMGQWVTAEHFSYPPGCSVPGAKVRLGGWEAETKSLSCHRHPSHPLLFICPVQFHVCSYPTVNCF